MGRNKLYALIITACTAGYIWTFFNYTKAHSKQHSVCLIKQTTNIPCPSCGATRSVISLIKGRFTEALYWNPIGILLAIIMIICPLWIIFDSLSGRSSLFNWYKKSEAMLRQKRIAIPAIFLLLINWIWNIYKGL